MISFNPSVMGSFAGGFLWRNRSEKYLGQLLVVSVPRGNQWAITLSDAPNRRRPAQKAGIATTDMAASRRQSALAVKDAAPGAGVGP